MPVSSWRSRRVVVRRPESGPELHRADTRDLLEYPAEVLDARIADARADLVDVERRGHEQSSGLVHAQARDVLGEGLAGLARELEAEVVLGYAGSLARRF